MPTSRIFIFVCCVRVHPLLLNSCSRLTKHGTTSDYILYLPFYFILDIWIINRFFHPDFNNLSWYSCYLKVEVIGSYCGEMIQIPMCPPFLPRGIRLLDVYFVLNNVRISSAPLSDGIHRIVRIQATLALDGARIQCRAKVQLENGENQLMTFTVYVIAVEGKLTLASFLTQWMLSIAGCGEATREVPSMSAYEYTTAKGTLCHLPLPLIILLSGNT